MSMNLTVECGGAYLDLWQTPTYITYMCVMNSAGQTGTLTGDDAIRALHMYLTWVKNSLNGVWNDKQAYQDTIERVQDEVDNVKNFLQNHPEGDFEVYAS